MIVGAPLVEAPIVSVVNNDASICHHVRHLVESMNLACRTFDSGSEFLQCYDPRIPGCAVLALRIADMSGVQIQHRLQQDQSPLPVLFLSQHATVDVAVRVMKAGAVDFLSVPFDGQRLWESIQRAIHLCQHRLEQMERHVEWQDRLASLKDYERDLLEMILAGRRSKDIASSQQIPLRTVEARRARLMKKLQVESTPELFHWASNRTQECRLHGGRCYSIA